MQTLLMSKMSYDIIEIKELEKNTAEAKILLKLPGMTAFFKTLDTETQITILNAGEDADPAEKVRLILPFFQDYIANTPAPIMQDYIVHIKLVYSETLRRWEIDESIFFASWSKTR